MQELSENVVRTVDVIGKEVFSPDQEKLGRIEEIVLGKVSGKVKYFVLSFDTFMGFGGKYFAFPWQSIDYNKNEESFILNVEKDKLKESQGFDKDSWPDMAQPEWQNKIKGYYGTATATEE